MVILIRLREQQPLEAAKAPKIAPLFTLIAPVVYVDLSTCNDPTDPKTSMIDFVHKLDAM